MKNLRYKPFRETSKHLENKLAFREINKNLQKQANIQTSKQAFRKRSKYLEKETSIP